MHGRIVGLFPVADWRALLRLWMPGGDRAWGSENGREHASAGSGAEPSGKCASAKFLFFRLSGADEERGCVLAQAWIARQAAFVARRLGVTSFLQGLKPDLLFRGEAGLKPPPPEETASSKTSPRPLMQDNCGVQVS